VFADAESSDPLSNINFISKWTKSGRAPLINGQYIETLSQGSKNQTKVALSGIDAHGMVNKQEVIVAVTVSDTEEGSKYFDLALLMKQNNAWVNVDVIPLGDRVRISNVNINNGQIVVHMKDHFPDDKICCPTRYSLATYAVAENKFVDTSTEVSTERGALFVDGSWKWQHTLHNNGTKTQSKAPENYTLSFKKDGQLAAQADCNEIEGSFKLEGSLLTLNIDNNSRTKCSPGSLDNDYLNDLSMSSLIYVDGNDLYIDLDKGVGTMKFTK